MYIQTLKTPQRILTDYIPNLFFIFQIFRENKAWYFMQIVSFAWNVKACYLDKIRKKIFLNVICWTFLLEAC